MRSILLIMLVSMLFIIGCSDGDDGENGIAGKNGIAGITGPSGVEELTQETCDPGKVLSADAGDNGVVTLTCK